MAKEEFVYLLDLPFVPINGYENSHQITKIIVKLFKEHNVCLVSMEDYTNARRKL